MTYSGLIAMLVIHRDDIGTWTEETYTFSSFYELYIGMVYTLNLIAFLATFTFARAAIID